MKLNKWFYITFFITYIIIGCYLSSMVGIKYPGYVTFYTSFYDKFKVGFIDHWMVKTLVSLVCSFGVNHLCSNKRSV